MQRMADSRARRVFRSYSWSAGEPKAERQGLVCPPDRRRSSPGNGFPPVATRGAPRKRCFVRSWRRHQCCRRVGSYFPCLPRDMHGACSSASEEARREGANHCHHLGRPLHQGPGFRLPNASRCTVCRGHHTPIRCDIMSQRHSVEGLDLTRTVVPRALGWRPVSFSRRGSGDRLASGRARDMVPVLRRSAFLDGVGDGSTCCRSLPAAHSPLSSREGTDGATPDLVDLFGQVRRVCCM